MTVTTPGDGWTKGDCAAVLENVVCDMPGGWSRSNVLLHLQQSCPKLQINDFRDKRSPTCLNLKDIFIQRFILESYPYIQSGKPNIFV